MTTVHVWDRTKVGWHLTFGAFVLVGVVLLVAESDADTPRKLVVLALLAGLSAAYATAGAKALNRERRGQLYIAGAIPATVAMYALVPAMAVLFFALYPQIWSLLPTRRAVAATAVTSLSVGATVLVSGGFSEDAIGGASIILIGLFPAVLLGLWITRIIEQSHGRARLLAELEETKSDLAEVSHEAGVLAERERLARDLHDTLAQGSTSVLLLLQAARKALPDKADQGKADQLLALAEETTRENLSEIRSLVAALTPEELNGSLPAALERLTARLGRELGITAISATTGDHRALPADREVALLRVTQEALANVRKHSGATEVAVRLDYTGDGVTLTVRDNGRGIAPGTPTGYGLDGSAQRVRQVGGEFEVASERGVTVCVRLKEDE